MYREPLTLGKILKTLFFGGLIILFAAYTLYQSRILLTGPTVSLSENYETIQHERRLTFSGNAQNITTITINGRPIVTTARGDFKEHIVLENGYTTVTIAAEDRYGRRSSLERTFVYVPQTRFIP